jgi:ATP-dependent phosphoenolpyruvate carboxykinase
MGAGYDPNEIYIGKEDDPRLDVGETIMNNLLNIKTPAESVAQTRKADFNLSNHGVANLRLAYWNLATEALLEEAVFRGEGVTSIGGPFIAHTGKHTARSANDKFVVRHTDSEGNIWWGTYNRPYTAEKFEELFRRILGPADVMSSYRMCTRAQMKAIACLSAL